MPLGQGNSFGGRSKTVAKIRRVKIRRILAQAINLITSYWASNNSNWDSEDDKWDA